MSKLTSEEKAIQEQMLRLLTHPTDKVVLTKIIDQSFRSNDKRRVADQINAILTDYGIPDFFSNVEKLLVQMADQQQVECVLLRDAQRRSICVSSQVGCAMGCVFCASGLDGVDRNLTKGEILEQMLRLQARLDDGERKTGNSRGLACRGWGVASGSIGRAGRKHLDRIGVWQLRDGFRVEELPERE